jgi:acyl-CoA thioesterase YciA
MQTASLKQPSGELVTRTLSMPKDTNFNGDIFGGWVLSQMDLGGSIIAKPHSPSGRTVTVAIDAMSFVSPIKVGACVSCYATILKKGHTSIKIRLEVWSYDYIIKQLTIVTHGVFTYVAVDEDGKPIPILKE